MVGDYSWGDQDPDEMQSSLEFAGPDDDFDDDESEGCECGSDCQRTFDGNCGCDTCAYCHACYANCECEICDKCRELEENCDCEDCESCTESIEKCCCLKCDNCNKSAPDCLCDACACPVCRLVESLKAATDIPSRNVTSGFVFTRSGALWTREEDQFISSEYQLRRSFNEIASETGRAVTAILSRLNSICFPHPEKDLEYLYDYVPRPWTPFEIDALSHAYYEGAPLAPLAIQMQRPMWELRNHLIEKHIAKPVGLEQLKYGADRASASRSRRWAPEDLQLLTELFAASHGIEVIAERLERTVGAVISKLLSRHLLDEVDINLAMKQASSRYMRVKLKQPPR